MKSQISLMLSYTQLMTPTSRYWSNDFFELSPRIYRQKRPCLHRTCSRIDAVDVPTHHSPTMCIIYLFRTYKRHYPVLKWPYVHEQALNVNFRFYQFSSATSVNTHNDHSLDMRGTNEVILNLLNSSSRIKNYN